MGHRACPAFCFPATCMLQGQERYKRARAVIWPMTHHGDRPTKKLVPSISTDRTCEHRFTEEDVITLEVDCGTCSGAQSIENEKCAAGIVNILASGVVPEVIVLKRYMHVRYRSGSTRWLREAGCALALLRRIESQPEDVSDKRCLTCPASRRNLASELMRVIRSDPKSFRASKAWMSDAVSEGRRGVNCPSLSRCVEQFASTLASVGGDE